MIDEVDHLGIMVEDLEANSQVLESLGISATGTETNEEFELQIAFHDVGELDIELVQAGNYERLKSDVFPRFPAMGLHHVAFRVKDIKKVMEILQEEGFEFVQSKPMRGARGSRVTYLSPSMTGDLNIELVERPSE